MFDNSENIFDLLLGFFIDPSSISASAFLFDTSSSLKKYF
jgi:hypothetical protein